jgi:hypothetical protein
VALVTAAWAAVVAVGLATIAIKAAGTLLLAGERGGFAVDARLAGLAAGAVALAFRAPLLLVVTVAAATAAAVRALG